MHIFQEPLEGSQLRSLKTCINAMKANFVTHAYLCSELEAFADSLPSSIDRQKCLHLSRLVLPTLKRAHDLEEDVLFRLLLKVFAENKRLEATLERLRFEHCEDQSCAEEVSLTLLECGSTGVVENPEMVGYLLRTLFEGVRRHTAFEKDHIVPMAEWAMSEAVCRVP